MYTNIAHTDRVKKRMFPRLIKTISSKLKTVSQALEVQYPDNNTPPHSENSNEEYMDAADEDETSVKEKEDDTVNDNKGKSAAKVAYGFLAEDEDDTCTDENNSFVEEDKNNAVDTNKTPSNPTSMSAIQKRLQQEKMKMTHL